MSTSTSFISAADDLSEHDDLFVDSHNYDLEDFEIQVQLQSAQEAGHVWPTRPRDLHKQLVTEVPGVGPELGKRLLAQRIITVCIIRVPYDVL